MLFPEKLLLMGGACSQAHCLPPAQCWGHSLTHVYGYLSLSPGQKALWNGANLCQGCLHIAKLVVPLWMGSIQEHIGGDDSTTCMEAGSTVLMRFTSWSSEGGDLQLGLR